ncbi:MAG: hypothetical protein FWC68_03450 [Oscillospiraceae bacterium]|nr:hypothetical protein [Oscillospiraceae bacterium]
MLNKKGKLKNKISKFLALLIVSIMVLQNIPIQSIFTSGIFANPGGGIDGEGFPGGHPGQPIPPGIIGWTSTRPGTKISFMIIFDEDEDFYIDGGAVGVQEFGEPSLPVSAVGLENATPWWGTAMPLYKYPIFFIRGAAVAREVTYLAPSEEVILTTLTPMRPGPDISMPEVFMERYTALRNRLLHETHGNWTTTLTATAFNNHWGHQGGHDLTMAMREIIENGGDIEEFLMGIARSNILTIGALLHAARAIHFSTDLDLAIAAFNYKARVPGAERPNQMVQVIVKIEPMLTFAQMNAVFNLPSGYNHATVRTFEAMLAREHNFPRSDVALDNAIWASTWDAHWLGQITQSVVRRTGSGGILGPSGGGAAFNERAFYTGPIGGGVDATRDNYLLGFFTLHVPWVGDTSWNPAVTVVKVHEYGQFDADGVFIVERARNEIIPILDYRSMGGYIWRHNGVRIITDSQLISTDESFEGMGDNQGGYDFTTHNLVEWWSTPNMHTEEGFHERRGTPYPEVNLQGMGDRNTSLPLTPEMTGNNWLWRLYNDPSIEWDETIAKIMGVPIDGAMGFVVTDPLPYGFTIPIVVDLFEEDDEIPDDAIETQVIFLRYQHVEQEIWEVIIIRRVNSDGTYTESLYRTPRRITTSTYIYTDERLIEWFVTYDLRYLISIYLGGAHDCIKIRDNLRKSKAKNVSVKIEPFLT